MLLLFFVMTPSQFESHYCSWQVGNCRWPRARATITRRHFFLFPKTSAGGKMVARGAGKTESRDKSTIKRRAKYKFYLTAVALCTYLYPCLCVCAREKKIINALLSSTLSIGHGHHMVRRFRWLVGFVDPRAQGIDEKRANRCAARYKSIESSTVARPWTEIAIVIHLIAVIRFTRRCSCVHNSNNRRVTLYLLIARNSIRLNEIKIKLYSFFILPDDLFPRFMSVMRKCTRCARHCNVTLTWTFGCRFEDALSF